MADIKHIGRQISNKRRCVVTYRVVPKDPNYCLVVYTDSLESADHDTLIKTVESNAGQNAYEFAEVMARTSLSDGRNMLYAFSNFGKLVKMPTEEIEMTPNTTTVINLQELNKIIADQKGVTVEDLALQDTASSNTAEAVKTDVDMPVVTQDEILTDEALAAQYRSQADALFKEAKRLREQAEELVPTKRKTAKKTESA